LVQGQSANVPPNIQLRLDDEPLPDALAQRVAERETKSSIRKLKDQTRALDRLKRKTTALPAYEREVLFWLSRRRGQWFTREDITRILYINPKSVTMQKLVDTALVERDKRSKFHKFRFRDRVLQDMFPDLDVDYVLDQISPIKEKIA
jgi:hypothetical protein